ncbi:MAG: hypothetical protein FWB84_04100, partial [Candidatus Bathyarchaeota archaeon]|nr:hypothetical protein [Candidatus Termiticorpusculum sp.]
HKSLNQLQFNILPVLSIFRQISMGQLCGVTVTYNKHFKTTQTTLILVPPQTNSTESKSTLQWYLTTQIR